MKGIRLENVEVMHRRHPDTFHIADRRAREQMQVRDVVKVILLLDPPSPQVNRPRGERLWVEITKVLGSRYTGKIASVPDFLPVKFGDVIEFGPEHIADFQIRMALARPVPSGKQAGYVHPVGRHVRLVGGNVKAVIIEVDVPNGKGDPWVDRLTLPYEAVRGIEGDDPLQVRLN